MRKHFMHGATKNEAKNPIGGAEWAAHQRRQQIIDYLKKLSDEGFITVYAFVLMPNHVHIIWQQNKLNGKETPEGSFLKYTAHEFLKKLKASGQSVLYEVNAANKK